ncbi:MAG: hypothetical protein EHM39_11880 [Chloroflexi bacterium]|nr:MAG: hypothetical protein EHM39_11880 [Chloroflexota bacterium]
MSQKINQNWYRLLIPITDAPTDAPKVAAALRSSLEARDYIPFDPFPGGTGTPLGLTSMVRLFVAPPQDGWVVVLGEYPENLIDNVSRELDSPVLYGWLTETEGGFALFEGSTRRDDPAAFDRYLRRGQSDDILRRAFAGELKVEAVDSDKPPVAVLGADALPPELRQMAEDQGADPVKAGKMFERISGTLLNRLGGGAGKEEQEQARAMIMGGGGMDVWNSLKGQRVRAIAGVLNLPGNWRLPSLQAVRDAYQVHRLRQRSPRLALMPGDREVMQAVPDALEYVPVYMGHK